MTLVNYGSQECSCHGAVNTVNKTWVVFSLRDCLCSFSLSKYTWIHKLDMCIHSIPVHDTYYVYTVHPPSSASTSVEHTLKTLPRTQAHPLPRLLSIGLHFFLCLYTYQFHVVRDGHALRPHWGVLCHKSENCKAVMLQTTEFTVHPNNLWVQSESDYTEVTRNTCTSYVVT